MLGVGAGIPPVLRPARDALEAALSEPGTPVLQLHCRCILSGLPAASFPQHPPGCTHRLPPQGTQHGHSRQHIHGSTSAPINRVKPKKQPFTDRSTQEHSRRQVINSSPASFFVVSHTQRRLCPSRAARALASASSSSSRARRSRCTLCSLRRFAWRFTSLGMDSRTSTAEASTLVMGEQSKMTASGGRAGPMPGTIGAAGGAGVAL